MKFEKKLLLFDKDNRRVEDKRERLVWYSTTMVAADKLKKGAKSSAKKQTAIEL